MDTLGIRYALEHSILPRQTGSAISIRNQSGSFRIEFGRFNRAKAKGVRKKRFYSRYSHTLPDFSRALQAPRARVK